MDRELSLKLTIRLYSDDDRRCFGPGIATLLERVETHKSLRAAAASMEMAYSKAWRIIRTAEDVFGCKLLISSIGGSHGGGAVLTPQAKQLLAAYQAFVAQVEAFAQEQFEQHFGSLQESAVPDGEVRLQVQSSADIMQQNDDQPIL